MDYHDIPQPVGSGAGEWEALEAFAIECLVQ